MLRFKIEMTWHNRWNYTATFRSDTHCIFTVCFYAYTILVEIETRERLIQHQPKVIKVLRDQCEIIQLMRYSVSMVKGSSVPMWTQFIRDYQPEYMTQSPANSLQRMRMNYSTRREKCIWFCCLAALCQAYGCYDTCEISLKNEGKLIPWNSSGPFY